MAVTRSIVAFLAAITGAAGSVVAGPLPPANTGHFYVSNFQGDNVVVYDNSGTVTRRFSDPDLDGPRGIVIGPKGQLDVTARVVRGSLPLLQRRTAITKQVEFLEFGFDRVGLR